VVAFSGMMRFVAPTMIGHPMDVPAMVAHIIGAPLMVGMLIRLRVDGSPWSRERLADLIKTNRDQGLRL
jgi:hypothetical protein